MHIFTRISSAPLNVTVNVFSCLINAFSSLFYFLLLHIHVFLIMQRRMNYKCRSSFDWFSFSFSLIRSLSHNEQLQMSFSSEVIPFTPGFTYAGAS